jgi:hypothetical protein
LAHSRDVIPIAERVKTEYAGILPGNGAITRNSFYIIGEDKNSGQGKPKPDQTFQVDFNELLFTWTALELVKMPTIGGA